MKRVVTVFFMGLFCLVFLKGNIVYAAPASELISNIEVSQPSGERFKITTKGDEHFNYIVAGEKDAVVIQEKDNYWYYGKRSEDGSSIESTGTKYLLESEPTNALKESDLSKTVQAQQAKTRMLEPDLLSGNVANNQKVVVVLVEFANVKLNQYTNEPRTIPEWSSTFFSQEENAISVANFYKESTGGKINLQPAQTTQFKDAPGVIKVTLDAEHPNPQGNTNLPKNEYFSDILTKITPYIDLNQYDTNKDNQLSRNELHVCFVFAGRDSSMSYGENGIWGHASTRPLPAPNGLTFSNGYMVTGELTNTLTRFGSRAIPSTIGLLAHEFGHNLGLPDLYNEADYRKEGGYGLGDHSLMSSGSADHLEGDLYDPKNYAGNSPAHLDAYSKAYLGVPVETVTSEKEVEIKSISSTEAKIYKINTATNDPQEYYLLENRPYEKFDRGRSKSKSSGLAIYHINERYVRYGNYYTSKYGEQLVTLIEADENKNGAPKLLKSTSTGSNSYFNDKNLLFNKQSSQTVITKQNSPAFDATIDSFSDESIKVKFSAPTIPVESVTLEQKDFTMDIGQQNTLKATITPENATNKEVEWLSSDPSILSVDAKGVVFANKSGVATITAKAKNTEPSARVTITVNPVKGQFGSVNWQWEEETQTVRFLSKGSFPSTSVSLNLSNRIGQDQKLKGKKIKKIVFEQPVKLGSNSSYLFAGLSELETIEGANQLNTSEVTNMEWMFYKSSLRQLDASAWDTSNVTSMASMFYNASSLQQVDVSNWDTSNVTSMASMFRSADSLQQIDVSNWDTSNVTSMNFMFDSTKSLQQVDASNWDTSHVKAMSFMFYSSTLQQLDVSNWDTSNVTDMSNMFRSADSLNTLILGAKSTFNHSVELTEKKSSPYTGFWVNQESNISYDSSKDLMVSYDGSHPGVFIRSTSDR